MTRRELIQLILNNCDRYGEGLHIKYDLDKLLEEIIKVCEPDLWDEWDKKHPITRKDVGGDEGVLPF